MQLFVALNASTPVDPETLQGAALVLDGARAGNPGLADAVARRWTSPSGRTAVAVLGHPPERTGGPGRVWEGGERLQVLDGFPIDRETALPTDGPVDPSAMDGKWGQLDVDGDRVAVLCDRIGAYAIFSRTLPSGVVALSNSPAMLGRLRPHAGLDQAAVEDYLVAGWIFGDRSPWNGVRRLPPGRSEVTDGRLTPSSTRLSDLALDAASRPVHRDVEVGADLLRGTLAAVGRDARGPIELGLSGGRDSRIVLAAALAAGLNPACFTVALVDDPAYPETDDVRVARELTGRLGLPHEVRADDPTTIDESERWLRAITSGASPMDAGPSSTGVAGRTPIVLSGAAMELGWLTHGIELTRGSAEDVIRESVSAWVHTRPGHMGRRGAFERVVERGSAGPRAWAAAGVPTPLLAESFFAFERTANWAAPTHFAFEPFFDTVAPGWSADLLPSIWALSAEDREQDRWRRGMVHALCPEIEDVPFGGAATMWPDDAGRESYMLWGEKMDKVRRTTNAFRRGNGLRRSPHQAASMRELQRSVREAVRDDLGLERFADMRHVHALSRLPVTRMPSRLLARLSRLGHVARLLREG